MMVLRLARAFDEALQDPEKRPFARIATAVAKFWTSKRAPDFVFEAMECHGGNGYVEESILPRLYREAPLSSIWEGCSNVISLDILRAIAKQPEALEAFLDEVDLAAGGDRRLDAAVAALRDLLGKPGELELQGRRMAERMALVLEGALMVRHATPEMADAFCGSRLAGEHGATYGTLSPGLPCRTILERACPDI